MGVFAIAACGGATASAIGDRNDAGGSANVAVDGDRPADAGGRDASGAEPERARVHCGSSTCSVSGGGLGSTNASFCCIEGDTFTASCAVGTANTCRGHLLMCDEAADCQDGAVCCAEEMRSGPGQSVAMTCRSTCITGAPRVQVCTSDQECENGGPCKAYDCRPGLPALRFCSPPAEVCQP
jgi:hypothetical protein